MTDDKLIYKIKDVIHESNKILMSDIQSWSEKMFISKEGYLKDVGPLKIKVYGLWYGVSFASVLIGAVGFFFLLK